MIHRARQAGTLASGNYSYGALTPCPSYSISLCDGLKADSKIPGGSPDVETQAGLLVVGCGVVGDRAAPSAWTQRRAACGRPSPRAQRPWVQVMLVLARSRRSWPPSMKTRRGRSSLPWYRIHLSRLRATSRRVCSATRRATNATQSPFGAKGPRAADNRRARGPFRSRRSDRRPSCREVRR